MLSRQPRNCHSNRIKVYCLYFLFLLAALAFRFEFTASVAAPGATTTTATEWFFDDFDLNFFVSGGKGKSRRAGESDRDTYNNWIHNSYFSHVSKGIENFFNLMHDAHRHHTIWIFLKSLYDLRFSLFLLHCSGLPAARARASRLSCQCRNFIRVTRFNDSIHIGPHMILVVRNLMLTTGQQINTAILLLDACARNSILFQ